MDINWGGLGFRVSENGPLSLIRNFDFDNSAHAHRRMPFVEAELAGDSASGAIRMHGAEASENLKYVSHRAEQNSLEILLRSDALEIACCFEKYNDTNAVRVTQRIRRRQSGATPWPRRWTTTTSPPTPTRRPACLRWK